MIDAQRGPAESPGLELVAEKDDKRHDDEGVNQGRQCE
jgi:hypothetical protein